MNAATSTATTPAAPAAAHRRRRKRRRDTTISQLDRRIVLAIAAASACCAVFSNARPTGFVLTDGLLTAAFAAVVTVASSRAKRWTLVWLSGGATALSIGDDWVIAGAIALGLCGIAVTARKRDKTLGALIGALAVQAALNAPELGFFGLPSLLAAVAVAPVLWSAYVNSSARLTRRIWRAGLVVAGVCVLAAAGLALAAMSARNQVADAVTASQQALDALQAGHQERAGQLFTKASEDFDAAHRSLSAPWALPSRAVPLIGPQANALTTAADSGRALSTAAAHAATAAPYQQLRASSGQIDLVKLEDMRRPLDTSVDELHRARSDIQTVQTGWLVAPIATKLDEFEADIKGAIPDAELAAQAVHALPDMLGANGTRRYFIAFGTPAETRFQGGFIGAYGELTATNGKVTLSKSGPIDELSDAPGAAKRKLTGSRIYQERYARFHPERFFQNLTASPDLPDNAAAIGQLYPQAGGSALDGVVYVDPYGLAALLKLTGPITVEGQAEPLTADNAANFLLREQYLQGRANSQRQDALIGASKTTFDALTSRDLPSPRALADALAPAVEQGHLMVTAFDDGANAFLDRLGTVGEFLDTAKGDYLDVRVSNAGGNKIDSFLTRKINYRVTFDPATGKYDSVATIELHNDAPATGLPDYVIGNIMGEPTGTNRLFLSVYAPGDLVRAERDGANLPIEAQHEYGGDVYSALLSVPPGATTTVELHLQGATTPGDYQLRLGHQPLVTDDQATISVAPAEKAPRITSVTGGLTQGSERATWSGAITRPMTFTAGFENRSP